MDPNACMERLREAYVDGDHDEIISASADLYDWITRGGFLPTLNDNQLSALLIMTRLYTMSKTKCIYCGCLNCDYDCDESQAGGFDD